MRLRDAAFAMGLNRCTGMLAREYSELAEMHWQRCRLPGVHRKRMPDHDRLNILFGSFEAACAWADDFLGLGEGGHDS